MKRTMNNGTTTNSGIGSPAITILSRNTETKLSFGI